MSTQAGPMPYLPPVLQSDAVLAQAAPVQNTWYTILDTTRNVRVYKLWCMVADTGETLQSRVTIDGVVLGTTDLAAVANTEYVWYKHAGYSLMISSTDTTDMFMKYSFVEARSVKIEIRKTTANGAGQLNGRVTYGKW